MTTSHRQIFRASAIIGSASVIKVGIGVASTKVIAMLLGPIGIGLLGLYQNILQVANTLAGFGLASSGVRQFAACQGDAANISLIRKALFIANLLLGVIGAIVLWSVREEVATSVMGGAEHAEQVGYLGIGVLLTLLATSQTTVLQGLRRLGDLARVQILSALASAITGSAAIWLWRDAGLVAFLVAVPATSILIAAWYVRKLPKASMVLQEWEDLRKQWEALFSLGIPLMTAALLTLVVQLIARSWVTQKLGLESAGFFQAAWLISMSYLGFVLNAMGTDYYPRLTGLIHDKTLATKLVNEQTELLVLMTAPILLIMMTFAPWVIEALYSDKFIPAADLLRWQTLGDIVKVMTWPMGFVVLAQGRGLLFIVTQLNWNAWYLAVLWFGMSSLNLQAIGIAFVVAYCTQFIVVFIAAKRLVKFKSNINNILTGMTILLMASATFVVSSYEKTTGIIVGAIALLVTSLYCYKRLDELLSINEWLTAKLK